MNIQYKRLNDFQKDHIYLPQLCLVDSLDHLLYIYMYLNMSFIQGAFLDTSTDSAFKFFQVVQIKILYTVIISYSPPHSYSQLRAKTQGQNKHGKIH